MQKTQARPLGREDPPETGMATHSSILAWKIPRAEEPGGLQLMESLRVGHNWVITTFTIQMSLMPSIFKFLFLSWNLFTVQECVPFPTAGMMLLVQCDSNQCLVERHRNIPMARHEEQRQAPLQVHLTWLSALLTHREKPVRAAWAWQPSTRQHTLSSTQWL